MSCTCLVKLDSAVEQSRISARKSSQLKFLKPLKIKGKVVFKRYLKYITKEDFTILNFWK